MADRLPCLVVGASGGVGSAIFSHLIADGHEVVGTFCGSAQAQAGQGEWVKLDVTEPAACDTVVQDVAKRFSNRFHLIICCGVLADKPMTLVTPEEWRHVISVNLDGPFYLLRSAFRSLAVGGVGRVVLLGSLSGRFGFPGQAAYASSKAGLEALCRVAAVELGRFGVTCNVVAPGALAAGMAGEISPEAQSFIKSRTPTRCIGTADQVASSVSYLLSPEAGHITGQTLHVDGGFSIA